MKLFTIGFTQKSAESFFEILTMHHIQRIADIRLRPDGQLAGFAKKDDLPFLLTNLAKGCQYIHLPELAPTKEILNDYRNDGDWPRYAVRFEKLMDERRVPDILKEKEFELISTCLLCSESKPDKCHRRLVAERMAAFWPDVEIIHL